MLPNYISVFQKECISYFVKNWFFPDVNGVKILPCLMYKLRKLKSFKVHGKRLAFFIILIYSPYLQEKEKIEKQI